MRLSVTLAAGLASCLHTAAPRVPSNGKLELSERASGPRGRAPFAVVAAGPRGETDQLVDPGITLVFNRAMRQLGGAPYDAIPAVTIASSEGRAVKGRFRWVGTHGMLFEPGEHLPGSTRFTVTVPRGTRALDHSELASDYTLEFATPRPQLIGSYPTTGSHQARADAPIFLQFSQPIAPEELLKNLRVTWASDAQKSPQPVVVRVSRSAPRWAATPVQIEADPNLIFEKPFETRDTSGEWLAIVPNQPLPQEAKVQIVIAKGLRSEQGPLGTDAPIDVSLGTYGPLRLLDLRCARQTLGRCQAHRDFTAVLSTPVHPNEFRRYVKISGPSRPAKPNKAATVVSPRAKLEHPLALDPDYGDRFKITLRAGMTDLYGQKLAKDVTVELATEDPFVPVSTAAKGKARPQPKAASDTEEESSSESSESATAGAVKRRPILKYDLEIGVRGHILEALSGPGGVAGPSAHKIPVSAVNVPTYRLYSTVLPESSLVRQLEEAVAEPDDARWNWISPAVPSNTRAVKFLDLRSLLNGATRGTARIAVAGLGQLDSVTQTTLNVTDLAITARVSRFGSLVWVTHLSTGAPAARANVSVYKSSGDVVCAGQTDARGLVAFSSKELKPIRREGVLDPELLLVARAGDDFTYQRLERSHSAYDSNIDMLQKGQWVGLVFTDRGVYRPGELVKAGGYFRRTAASGFSILPGQEYQYEVRDSQSEIVAVGRNKLDAFGAMAADVKLTKSAALGRANLTVRFGGRYEEQFSAEFEVLAYKPAEFKVHVEPQQHDVIHGQSATFIVNSDYLFGSPVTGARVEQYVTRTETSYTPPNTQGFVVDDGPFLQDLRFTTQRGAAYSQETGELDDAGRLIRVLELNAPQQSRPEQMTFEAEVQDLTQQTQAGRANILVHPAQFYLGLKQPTKRFLALGAEMPTEVLAITPKGVRQQSVPITLQLWRRTWSSVIEDRAADAPHYKTNVHDEDAGHCVVTSASVPVGCHLRLAQPGYYLLRASANDALGNPIHSSFGLYAVDDRADDTAMPVGWNQLDRRTLGLEADQSKYRPGDTARILVKSPFKEGTALVTVERAGIFEQQVVPMKGKMPVVEVPIKDEYFPNAFVSVHLVRGRVAAMPEPGAADVGAPEFRVGYLSLRVDPESRRLKVDLSTNQKEYHPGDQVEAKVALHRLDGAASAGTVTFYAVDEGVLMLTGYKTPDPLPAFSEPRGLGVVPVESRENLARILKLQNGERIPILGFEMARNGRSDKGNEVGDGGEMPGNMRSDFRTTVHFEAGRAVGNDGQATFHFKLPDNLTSFRLMAVAAGAQDRFGFGESSITTSRKLMARPAMPRILRSGDTLEAGVIVTSKGLANSLVDVSLKATGVVASGPMKRRVSLPKDGQVEVRFPVKAVAAGSAVFEFTAQAGSVLDQVRVTRKVEQPVHWLTAASYGSTDTEAAIALGDVKGYRKDRGELSVTLSSSAIVGLKSVFEELSAYPYGCTEQLTSRMLPVLAAPKLAEQQQYRLPATQGDAIDDALSELTKRQRYDGSFGYWQDDTQGHTWLTAYALLALEQANKAGYFVPKRIRDQAVQYLTSRIDSLGDAPEAGSDETTGAEEEGIAEEPKPLSSSFDPFAARALSPAEQTRLSYAEALFIADILARVGQLDQSRLNKLITHKGQFALSSKIHLLSAMARRRMPRQALDHLLSEIISQVTVGPFEARVEATDPVLSTLLESPARSTAILLQAVLAIDPKLPVAPKLARGLVRLRTGASYRNTQEDAWALLALEDYRRLVEAEPPNFGAHVFFADERVAEFSFRGLPVHSETSNIPADILLAHAGSQVAVRVVDQGIVNYAMQLRMAQDGTSSAALDEGFSVEKLTRVLEPNSLEEASKMIPDHAELRAGLGQLVLVDLLLESAESRDQIVLDDPLPAGLEPVEFGFQTTAQALSISDNTAVQRLTERAPRTSRYGRINSMLGVHREMHDDHVLHFIPHLEPGIYHFRYLARATSPGQFVVPASRASCMYDTEIFGQSPSSVFTVGLTRK